MGGMMPPEEFDDLVDEVYFQESREDRRTFDSQLLRQPLSVLPTRKPIVLAPHSSATEAMREMQRQHRGCVLISEDGTQTSNLVGIFTERDVLLKIVGKGRNPTELPLSDVMSTDVEGLLVDASVAWVLNYMSAGGYRHVPVVEHDGRPVAVVSVRDVVNFLVGHFPREINTLPLAPGVRATRTREGA
jgi:CBS domain-containing protein